MRTTAPHPATFGRARRPQDHRRLPWVVLTILIVAGVWRAALAWTLPCLSRDSVTFCWYARDLGLKGLEHLRAPTTQQHPLFPLLVLGAQRVARGCGAPDAPVTWLRSGQAVSCLAGLAVVALAGAITRRLVRRLALPLDADSAGCCGMALAALLPLNVGLSAEVMSDQAHLALYLLGVWALLNVRHARAAVLCGLAGGLAFVTRPEGIVIIPAGLAALITDAHIIWRRRASRAALLMTGFLICAVPYWAGVGTLSNKKNPLNWLRSAEVEARSPTPVVLRLEDAAAGSFSLREGAKGGSRWTSPASRASPTFAAESAPPSASFLLARLELLHLPWYALIPYAVYQLVRAGRVVIPLLAVYPLHNVRDRLWRPPLAGPFVCFVGHFALTVALLWHERYLDQRHMLVPTMLLLPLAAALVTRLIELAHQRRWPVPLLIVAVSGAVLALYSLRSPNSGDRYLADAARRLAERDPQIGSRLIMTASSERRIVFYANARWSYWYDVPGDVNGPREQILRDRPAYFIIETGSGFERQGNDQVVERLRTDPEITPHITAVDTWAAPRHGTLHVFRFDWGGG